MKIEKIHVVVNPAAGQDRPILAVLNRIFRKYGVLWSVSVTQKDGDAQQQTRDAVSEGADAIAVYGGDGSVTAVAHELIGTEIPLAILPGGTANVFAQELGTPIDLSQAAQLAVGDNAEIRAVDVGLVNHHHFLLRVGIGFEAKMIANADRELKDQLGFFAYIWSAAQNAVDLQQASYRLILDGNEINIDAVTCGIINSGRMGIGFSISPLVRIDDGLLDIIAVRQADLPAVGQILSNIMGLNLSLENPNETVMRFMDSDSVLHWQAREVVLETNPPQMIQYDGELLDAQEIRCRILPQALRILVPATYL